MQEKAGLQAFDRAQPSLPTVRDLMSVLPEASPAGSCAIAVMAKASIPGLVKTRLVPPLSAAQAAGLNTAFLQDVAMNLVQASCAARIAPYFAYGPAGTEEFFRSHVSRRVGLMECSFPNLGECLVHAITTMFDLGCRAACVLNSDSPTLPTSCLIKAAAALARPGDRAVLGPSTDGGYYFLGLKKPHRRLFEDIDWSTPRVAEQTCHRAAELGLEVYFLDTWYDVDDSAGLRQLIPELLSPAHSSAGASRPSVASHTRAALRELLDATDLGLRLGFGTPVAAPRIVR